MIHDKVSVLRFRQVSVLSERMRTVSEAVSTPPGSPDPTGRKPAVPGSPSLSGSRTKLSGSKTHLAGLKPEVPNGVKAIEKKEEEKKLIEAEKMETERVKFCNCLPNF